MSTVAICGDSGTGLTATGSTATDAYQINRDFSVFDTVPSGTGAKLPPTEMGAFLVVTNNHNANMKVYPYEATTTISGAAAGNSITVKSLHSAIFYAVSNSAWFSMQATFV